VKRGEDSGHIKITLRGDHKEEQITIMRKINTSNKSEWVLNGGLFDTRYTLLLNATFTLIAIVKSFG